MTSQKDKMTPGLWCVEDPLAPETLWVVQAGKQTYEWFPIAVCTMPDEDDHLFTGAEVLANVKAIAALPDMVEALREAEDFLSSTFENLTNGYIDPPAVEPLVKVRAALAKAGL